MSNYMFTKTILSQNLHLYYTIFMTRVTIKSPVISKIEVKKSTFITYLFHCDDQQQANLHLQEVKHQHPKANHHCSAFISKDALIERFDDDGEPTHTAGKPMLLVLTQHNLHSILAITVRYFGGTLLGKGGLVKAYTNSVLEALKQTQLIAPTPFFVATVKVAHHYAPILESYLYKHTTITEKTYTENDALISFECEPNDTLEQSCTDLVKGNLQWLEKMIILKNI